MNILRGANFKVNNANGLTTIEEAKEFFEVFYEDACLIKKVELKCWMNHAESRNKNGNLPFTYYNYVNHMKNYDYIEQIKLNMIDCSDIGGKDAVIAAVLHN